MKTNQEEKIEQDFEELKRRIEAEKSGRFELVLLLVIVAFFTFIIGLMWLATYVGEHYGQTAGLLTVLLPMVASCGYLIYALRGVSKGRKQQ